MIRRISRAILLFTTFFGLTTTSVHALTIRYTTDNDMVIIEPQVLGDSTKYPVQVAPQTNKETIVRQETRPLKIQVDKYSLKAQVKPEKPVQEPEAIKKLNEQEVKNLKVEMPSGQAPTKAAETAPSNKNFQTLIKEDRTQRGKESIELENRQSSEGNRFQLKSREVTANMPAEVTLNPQTRDIFIEDRVGGSQKLNMLPDQAAQRLRAAGLITENELQNSDFLVELSPENQLQYAVQVNKEKKLFGLFRRTVATKVFVNDTTGETKSQEVPVPIWGKILNRLSF